MTCDDVLLDRYGVALYLIAHMTHLRVPDASNAQLEHAKTMTALAFPAAFVDDTADDLRRVYRTLYGATEPSERTRPSSTPEAAERRTSALRTARDEAMGQIRGALEVDLLGDHPAVPPELEESEHEAHKRRLREHRQQYERLAAERGATR